MDKTKLKLGGFVALAIVILGIIITWSSYLLLRPLQDPAEFTKLLVVGGVPGVPSSEVLDLDLRNEVPMKCQAKISLINAVSSPSGGLLDGDKVVICGGQRGDSDSNKCIYLESSEETWFATLQDSRMDAASIVLDDGQTLWITGGHQFPTRTLDTTELVSDSGTVSWGPKLPEKRQDHCLVRINSTTAVLIGGSDRGDGSGEFSNKTWFFNRGTEQWTRGPDLNVGRIHHSCVVVTDKGNGHQVVIVAGGLLADEVPARAIEILDLQDPSKSNGSWTESGSMIPPTYHAHGVIAKNGTSFYTIGGVDQNIPLKIITGQGNESTSAYVFGGNDGQPEGPLITTLITEYDVENGSLSFSSNSLVRLSVGRCCGLAMMVPDSMVDCS